MTSKVHRHYLKNWLEQAATSAAAADDDDDDGGGDEDDDDDDDDGDDDDDDALLGAHAHARGCCPFLLLWQGPEA